MKQIARLLAGLGVIAACQRGAGSAVPETYRDDIARLCNVVALSGADQLPADARALAIAQWLPEHLATDQAHAYLVKIQPLAGEPKAAALDAEARRVGLGGCALATEWRAPAP
jgi:hypothetical protein